MRVLNVPSPVRKPLALLAALLAYTSASAALGAASTAPSFSAPRPYDPAGGSIAAIAVRDLNHDRRSDVVVGTGGREIPDQTSVLLAGRGGRLARARPLGLAATGGVAVADLNGDGARDVVRVSTTLPTLGGTVEESEYAVSFGDGHGGFGAPTVTPTECCADEVAVGDFNRDGRRDLVLVPPLDGSGVGIYGTPRILFGDGTGKFPTARAVDVGLADGAQVADLNRDGASDLVVLTSSEIPELAYVLFGDGRGGFSAPKPLPAGGVVSLVVRKLNRDRWPDLATVSWDDPDRGTDTYSLRVLLGTPSGRFPRFGRYRAGRFPGEIVAADFNRDRSQDLAVTSSGSLLSLLGAGRGTFRPARRVRACSRGCGGPLAVGYFNRDRKPDLVATARGGKRLLLLLNTTRRGRSSACSTARAERSC